MGARPSRSLARNTALTGAVFTRCPAIATAPRPGCFRSSKRRHSVCRLRTGCFRNPGALLFPAPRRAGFFLSTMQKNTCIFKLT